jgi:hypothetical protein
MLASRPLSTAATWPSGLMRMNPARDLNRPRRYACAAPPGSASTEQTDRHRLAMSPAAAPGPGFPRPGFPRPGLQASVHRSESAPGAVRPRSLATSRGRAVPTARRARLISRRPCADSARYLIRRPAMMGA